MLMTKVFRERERERERERRCAFFAALDSAKPLEAGGIDIANVRD